MTGDKLAAWNSIYKDLDRVINVVEGMLHSPVFRDKEVLEMALFDLVAAREAIMLACMPTDVAH